MRGRLVAALAASGMMLVAAPSATAATQIGQTFTPNLTDGNVTEIQSGSPGNQYAAPFPGVITSWSFQASASPPPQLKFKVARHVTGDDFRIVADEGPHAPTAGMLNTYPAQIAVQAGDVIGLHFGGLGNGTRSAPGYALHYIGGDTPPGTMPTFNENTGFQLDVSAILEPDCDNDGLGDESQDNDLLSCDTSSPSAAIVSGPKDKTKRKTATFEFSGTDARAIAGFQCSLDGAAFTACTSPHTIKVKKGKHSFRVRAVDQAGNIGSPATDDWKVKKKRK